MATHSSNKDPIAKIVFLVSLVLLLAAVYALVSSLINTVDRNTVKGAVDTETLETNNLAIAANNSALIEKVIKPIGEVTIADASGVAAAGPARSGEEVYNAVCQACHSTGAAGAPKIDDKGAWESRVANGFDALMKTAIDGKGGMPARGGQNVSDAELKTSIAFIMTKAGFNLDIPKDTPAEAPTQEAKTEENLVTAENQDTAKETQAATQKTESTSEPTQPAKPFVEVATTTAAPASTQASEISGEKIYKSTCFACHGIGVAGAPKTGDKAIWEARIATGNDTLYNSAIKGIQGATGVMPPKGGNFSLSDDEVKAAVDYMIAEVK